MRLEIRDKKGKIRGIWVARTKRGFNQKQLKEQREVRLTVLMEAGYHISLTKHCAKCILPLGIVRY